MILERAIGLLLAMMLGGLAPLLAARSAQAVDEIQVYNSEINDPGQWSLQIHGNYVPQGRTEPDFPGGIVPDKALQGTPELALGVTDWWELGAYWPYALTRDGTALLSGPKLRSLFVAPHAKQRQVLLGVNFELSYATDEFADTPWGLEVRPIMGWRTAPWEVILNPIVDFALSGSDRRGEFEPALRVGYTVAPLWQVALEHYADLGPVDSAYASSQQAQTTYAVVDYNGEPVEVDFGVGHGWTRASDDTTIKFILGFAL
ncbi:MAG TPA: hypothetical protein VL359_08100 [bacterium]|nr:hypothetical protein [bacterium]